LYLSPLPSSSVISYSSIEGSIPIRNGTGASRTSVMFLGRIGIKTCFQEKGKRKEIRATLAWARRALYFEISKTFFSVKRARNMSMIYSAFKARKRFSISTLVA
jgi:hypothetical protein